MDYTIKGLPIELRWYILYFAGPIVTARTLCVSKEWQLVAKSESLWQRFCEDAQVNEEDKNSIAAGTSTWFQTGILLAQHFRESVILSASDKKQLLDWLPPQQTVWRLKYRGSRDGWLPHDFHKFCDGVQPTISIVLTKKENKLGGYQPNAWGRHLADRPQPGAFVFTLKNPHEIPPTPFYPAADVWSAGSYGATWGNGYDLGILGHPTPSPSRPEPHAWCRMGNTYKLPKTLNFVGDPHHLFDGAPRDFPITELEVFTPGINIVSTTNSN